MGRKEAAQDCCCNGICVCTPTPHPLCMQSVPDCPGMLPARWPKSLFADTSCRAKDRMKKADSTLICCLGGLGCFSAREQLSTLVWNATVNFVCFTAKQHPTEHSSYLNEGIKELVEALLGCGCCCPTPSPRQSLPFGMILHCRHTMEHALCPRNIWSKQNYSKIRTQTVFRFY